MRSTACKGWLQSLREWRDSDFRRAMNEAAAGADKAAYTLLAVMFSVVLVHKTWLREGLPGLALKAGTHPLLAACYIVLIGRKGSAGRRIYVAHRELFTLLFALQMQWTVRLTALHGGVNTIDHHGGSVGSLALLLLGHTTSLYGCLELLYARLLWPASAAVPALMAATSLLSGPRMCVRVLESPGVAEPLAHLHHWVGLINGAMLPPFASDLLTGGVADPMRQCLVVSAWMGVVVGAVLPATLLWLLEKRARRRFERRRQQQQGGAALAGWPAGQQDGGGRGESGLPGPALQVYLASTITWLLACSLA